MIQPIGTVTYKGLRKSEAGEESYEKDDKILKVSEKFHADGKAVEEKAKKKKTETAEPVKKAPAVSAEGNDK